MHLDGTRIGGVCMDTLMVGCDRRAAAERFELDLPVGSPARLSYCSRVSRGPAFSLEQAMGIPSDRELRGRVQ